MNKRIMQYGSTHKLQMMLLKAFVIQLISGYIFLLFPATIVGFLVYFQTPNTGKMCSIILCRFLDYINLQRYLQFCSKKFLTQT
jgi:hypothetical protein